MVRRLIAAVVAVALAGLVSGWPAIGVGVAAANAAPADLLRGRLGGTQQSFVAAYGQPVRYLAEDELQFTTADFGEIVVSVAQDRATRVVVTPNRPPGKPPTVPDPADWSLAKAKQVVGQFSPQDAVLGTFQAASGGQTATGQSSALATAAAGNAACANAVAPFGVRLAMPTAQTVSMLTLTLTATAPPSTTSTAVGATAIAGTNGQAGSHGANASLRVSGGNVGASGGGGTITANGIRITLLQAQTNAVGSTPPAAGMRYVAVQVSIENQRTTPVHYQLGDFRLADSNGREYPAVCGVVPAITSGDLAPGATLRGWISFAVPETAVPKQFIYQVNGIRISLGIG